MKILLVADLPLKIDGKDILSSAGLKYALERIANIGRTYACVPDASNSKNSVVVRKSVVNDFIDIRDIAFIPKSSVWPSPSTIKILKNQITKVDLVIGYVPSLNAEIASFIAHKLGKKYFALMVACPWDGLWNQDFKRKIAAPYRFFLNRKVLKHADYALYVTGKFLQHRYPTMTKRAIGISDVVIENADDKVLEKRLLKISQYKNDKIFKIATTAALNTQYKGQRFVIKALKELHDKGFDNFEYFLIGGGDDSKLRNLAESLGLEDRVKFLGKVNHEEVFRLLDEIDIYVHPSLQEGLPRSVVEAMSRALPCIGANTGAIPELIDQEFVVEKKSPHKIAEKLLQLTNRGTLEKQAALNFNKAKEFEFNRLEQLRNSFYKSVAADFSQ